FDPGWEEMALICLIPEILVQICIGDLLNGFDIIHWINVAVIVIHIDTNFLESSLSEEESLNSSQGRPWGIICLFDQSKFLPLTLIQSTLHRVCFTQTLQCENQNLCIVLI